MVNALHKTGAGDTLADVSRQYYALEGPDGGVRDVEARKVTNAIRAATPTPLATFADSEALPPGTVLYVPTLRELNRAVYGGHEALRAALTARGYHHARKLLRYTPEQVVRSLPAPPAGVSARDVKRVWTLTAFLNLGGMDVYTAQYLYD